MYNLNRFTFLFELYLYQRITNGKNLVRLLDDFLIHIYFNSIYSNGMHGNVRGGNRTCIYFFLLSNSKF